MDSQPTYDQMPWDAIAASIQGDLSTEEEMELQQWLSLTPVNRSRYEELQRIWQEELGDYTLYRQADERAGWQSFLDRMGIGETGRQNLKVIRLSFLRSMKRWVSVAALFLLVAGIGYWLWWEPGAATVYETANNEQKRISLPDGSAISLEPVTRVRLSKDYNRTNRTVVLVEGEAFFEVPHQLQMPFTVNMGVASVKDIGTSFTIQKMSDSIRVTVLQGRVAFIKNSTGETRQLPAGMALSFYTREDRFGEISAANTGSENDQNRLRFDDAPLGYVITTLQSIYGKQIVLEDSSLAQKKITAHLTGESFENAVKVICSSLGLRCEEKNGTYILKSANPG